MRTPNELAPLIQGDLDDADKAGAMARRKHDLAVGQLLMEAAGQMPEHEFWDWAKRNFGLSQRKARWYMDRVLFDARRQTGGR
jgi:hypothetical protein